MRSAVNVNGWSVLLDSGAVGALSDAELLVRFTACASEPKSQAAFTMIVDRHGPMVLGVCRRVTRDIHAADDAFQAVFLVLARKAGGIRLGRDDSLGRWLYGVSVKVARRTRTLLDRYAKTERIGARDWAVAPIDRSPSQLAELRSVIDAEIARLPERYRTPVELCLLEGLSQKAAAERLNCPLGTVESRLHRARERLRAGLERKGFAPAIAGRAIQESLAAEFVAHRLAAATSRNVSALALGEAPGVAAAVMQLISLEARASMLRRCAWFVGIALCLGVAIGGGAGVGLAGRELRAPVQAVHRADPPRPSKLDQQFHRIESDYIRQLAKYMDFFKGSTIPDRDQAEAAKVRPSFAEAVRRIAAAAEAAPKDPAVRDAMIWVILQTRAVADDTAEFALAAHWLTTHFGDDPEAVRVGLNLVNWVNFERDALLLAFYASAKDRESKGLARFALANYLAHKSTRAEFARKVNERPTSVHDDLLRADGTRYTETELMPIQQYAYLLHLKQCDPARLREEARRLFEEVIADYADVRHITARDRMLALELKYPDALVHGSPLSDESKAKLSSSLEKSSRVTLGEVAKERLDEWLNLDFGRPAPEISGPDEGGKPLALSSLKGKNVVLVFWSAANPEMTELTAVLKDLIAKLKDQPFAVVGVNIDADVAAARKAIAERPIPWPNWLAGSTQGTLAARYRVSDAPSVFLIDANGTIQGKHIPIQRIERRVLELIKPAGSAPK